MRIKVDCAVLLVLDRREVSEMTLVVGRSPITQPLQLLGGSLLALEENLTKNGRFPRTFVTQDRHNALWFPVRAKSESEVDEVVIFVGKGGL